ncbi:glycosyltransferase [Rasiella rasia]|uniref:glycosyltransferase n=1 Tax=Rasiella rasia TaxID=2744027 RepID=UPI003850A321
MANLKHGKTIRGILSDKKIDIVYTYYNLSLCKRYLKLKKSPEYNFKLVVRIAGMRWFEQIKVNASLKEVYHHLFETADSLNFISHGLFQLYTDGLKDLEMTINSKHHFIKDIGVALVTDKPIRVIDSTSETLNCVMVSRFSRYQKRQDLLVEAISLLAKEIPIHLTLIGEGPNKEKMMNQVKNLGLSERITFLPFLHQEVLWSTVLNQNLLCHACEYEGLSKIIIESMAMGMPVLASDVLPLNSYISNGDNGFLVANSAEAWAQKLKILYKEKAQFKKIGTAASVYIKENYDASINVLDYEKQFEKLMKQ